MQEDQRFAISPQRMLRNIALRYGDRRSPPAQASNLSTMLKTARLMTQDFRLWQASVI
ncbi:hypothetical protein [Picosynechococcus sp. NKBG042902]|uniref:hypothetical protein n=1 Tax=Picosynechococcus sp. NKBG042902 TaxID=490193 RepID=UPI000A577743|nr:hypothetical protein [Picosynechococcus sp. NKBG042902]